MAKRKDEYRVLKYLPYCADLRNGEVVKIKYCELHKKDDPNNLKEISVVVSGGWRIRARHIERIPREHYKTLGPKAKMKMGDIIFFTNGEIEEIRPDWGSWRVGYCVKDFTYSKKVLRPIIKADRL